MKRASQLTTNSLTAATLLAVSCALAAESSKKEARVTRIIRDVNLLPSEAKPRSASLNDQVREGTAVRTGDESKSELTFLDLTITRLGANSIFSFNKAGRDVDLTNGSILLRVPKDSGGATIRTSGVTAGIAGTTVILESPRSGRNKLIVLEVFPD
ncbi:MAG TPA: FecR domain-containing protein [Chthoniobacterales bacterium]|nr:FecR domain-containing protein [Chthoniobacterales bacterium]